MKGNNVLKEDRVTSTIHIINGLVRGLTYKKQAKKVDTDYFVFAGNTIDTIIKMIQNKAAKDAIVIDDIGLQIIDRLYQEGLKNITLVLARIPKEHLAFVSGLIKKTFPNIKIDIKHIEEIDYMKTDLLISNPAYGAIGANITDTLRQKIDYEEFINLLPANDYKRNKTKDLFKYQSDMIAINNGFIDAAVTTHVARIHKNKVNNMTLDEFERSQYIDPSLDKYFKENSKHTYAAIDNARMPLRYNETSNFYNVQNSVIIGSRDIGNKHLAYDKNCQAYKWNVLKNLQLMDIVWLHPEKKTANEFMHTILYFDSEVARDNFVKFIYSKNGFRFISKVLTAINNNHGVLLSKVFPKVDWTRSWTVEEILRDYGYTEEEIAEVMADLDNFKGMDA